MVRRHEHIASIALMLLAKALGQPATVAGKSLASPPRRAGVGLPQPAANAGVRVTRVTTKAMATAKRKIPKEPPIPKAINLVPHS